MSKAFRNTGIEGGYGSIATQNWLLSRRREINFYSRVTGEKTSHYHMSRTGIGPAVKVLPKPFPKGTHVKPLIAALLQYEQSDKPAFHGSWKINECLRKAGLVAMVKEPNKSFVVNGETFWMGSLYVLTDAGRDYIKELKAKGR